MRRVFIAGATGYLGRYLCAEYQRQGWYVTALVRRTARAAPIAADQLVEAQATEPQTLHGVMSGTDLVISCLGITRQSDRKAFWQVDYQANVNLLREAERADVGRFAYIHALHADALAHHPMFAAKSAFVAELQRSTVVHTIIAPTLLFSAVDDLLNAAGAGRIWLFGDGNRRVNPIHGADVAVATADAIEAGRDLLKIGGPDVFSHKQLAERAFACLGTESQITFLPEFLRRLSLLLPPHLWARSETGPMRIFLSVTERDMVGPHYGTHHLDDHFKTKRAATSTGTRLTSSKERKIQ